MRRVNQGWKIAFFALLGFIAVCSIIALILFQRYFPEVDERHFEPTQPTGEEATFLIQTDKSKINALIATRIQEQETDMPYMVELMNDSVQFRSAIRIVGQEIPVTINFIPLVSPNGDLLLEVQTFSVGILQLPVEQILQLLPTWVELAEWIVPYPSERAVEVKITEIQVDESDTMQFRFLTFDLEQDNIELELIFK
ncbi:hypothetical protein JCM9140_1904 [Halalkalibacter wakoensis JCM 9140]|uniref:DUF2140 family protein n=1 Tax=Halalkalibacter wakoensis JCM 9140 TaxID=1236970 RepID=W4Q2C4_9BACI|nr:YpmS family protein [Halalkalibacter wakoensis]GAE25883.1 hypothetical protein JCM9140_1904 [Halalkalibacter wakoensis JCM 9140]